MRPKLILIALLIAAAALASCQRAAAPATPIDPTPTAKPVTEQVDAPQAAPETGADGEPTELACETHMASVDLVTAETVQVGQTLVVTATLSNSGCSGLGIPQIRLDVSPVGETISFDPESPEALTPGGVVGTGQSLVVRFELQAIAAGQAALKAFANFEVILGSGGPYYWGAANPSSEWVVTIED
jgi:hypothetical protein